MKKILPILLSLALLFPGCRDREAPVTNIDVDFTVPDTEDIVMYEINIGSFSHEGNLRGITARLHEIQALGINTIWLMPIHPIGALNSFGSPYCVKDYLEVNPQLGGLDDVKELVAEAHKRDMAVVLDWVANHTAWDNPWIAKYPNWYTQDASGHIISPAGTNWHDVADLNFGNAEMRLAMISAMAYWIEEAGIDGFRCDAADLVPFSFWQQAIHALNSASGRKIILLAEGSRDDHFAAGFQMNFAWDWYNALKNVFVANGHPAALHTAHLSEYAAVPPGKRKLRFTTNHDLSNERTPVGVFGTQQAALAASVATLFMTGAPLLYAGQEVGVNQPSIYTTGQAIDWTQNPDMLAAYTALLQFYNSSEVSRRGAVTYHGHADCIVFEKAMGSSKILVIINSRAADKTLPVPSHWQGSWKNALTNQPAILPENLQMSGHEYLVLKNF